MTYDELQTALRLLGFEDRITLRQIKDRYRSLAREHHPDVSSGTNGQMEALNRAYGILLAYAEGYRFSFSREEFLVQNDEARLIHQFSDDPLWGRG